MESVITSSDGPPPATWADFPAAEYQARVAKAQREMRAAGIDLLVLAQKENVRYFSGFRCGHWIAKTFPTGLLLIHPDRDPVLVTADFFAATARESSWLRDIAFFSDPHSRPRSVQDTVVNAIRELAGPNAVIGLELGHNLVSNWNLADYHAVREALPDAKFVSGADVIWACRMIKSAAEIDRLRTLTHITERAMVATRKQLHEGMTETDVARLTAANGLREGADGVLFLNIRAGQDRYASADAEPVDRPIRNGEMMIYDVGFTLRGYVSDIAYCTYFGKPSPRHHEIYAAVVRSQEAAIAQMRPGASARDPFRAAKQVLVDCGFGRSVDAAGHAVGLDVHEPPILAPFDDHVLEPGMVFEVENWLLSDEQLGVFFFEELVAITEDGHEVLTSLPHDELWATE